LHTDYVKVVEDREIDLLSA